MRAAAWVVLVLALGNPVAGQTKDNIWPDFKKGKEGDFVSRLGKDGKPSAYFQPLVVELIGPKKMLVKLGREEPPFLVQGHSTEDIADGQRVELKGWWRCVGTQKHAGRTYHAIEPATKK